MFNFWGSEGQPAQLPMQDGSAHSWRSSSTVNSPNSSRPLTPSSISSGSFNYFSQSNTRTSSSETPDIINHLKDKSVDELRKLFSDKQEYHEFLISLDQVKTQVNIKDELLKETLEIARLNLDKEPQIIELRNQCRIIRTTELAGAQEKLGELERQKEEALKLFSPSSLLLKLREAMKKTDEESETLHSQLLKREIDFGAFLQKYKKLRTTYHRQALVHLAATTSFTG